MTRLTEQQARCLRLAADGRTDRQIAAITGLQVGTVKTHIKRARQLLGGVTRERAIAIAHPQLYGVADPDLPCCAHCAGAIALLVQLRPTRTGLNRLHPWARLYDRFADVLIGAALPHRKRAERSAA